MKRLSLSFFFLLSIYSVGYAADIVSESVYLISTLHGGDRTLMTENSSLDHDAKVLVWTETETNSQRWRITATDDNASFYVDNIWSGKRLRQQSYSSIVQSDLKETDAYRWTFTPLNEAGYENCFYISNKMYENYVLELASGADNIDGVAVRLAEKETEVLPRQIWKIEQVDDSPNQLTPAIRSAMMQAWKDRYFDWLKQSTGFWGEAELMEIILDAYEATGDEEYKTMFEEVYEHFVSGSGGWGQTNGKDWMWNEYNDDIAWGVLATIRAYSMFGNSLSEKGINYLSIALSNYDKMYKRARYEVDGLYYLLRWKEGQDGTTSCVNGPAEVAACYLAMIMEKEGSPKKAEEYYEKAKELYMNQRVHMYVAATGQVYDSFDNGWASPYNQGTYLGAAVMLYNHYGDEMFKKDAEMIMDYSNRHLCNAHGIVTSCGSEEGDYANFKAILMRYVRRYVTDLGKPEYGEWLQRNALQAYNNRNSKGISRVAWETKTGEEDNWNSYGAFAAVSAAMNAPLDVNTIYKKAFSTIHAGSFNYISKVSSADSQLGTRCDMVNIKEDAYLGYNLVEFDYLATGIELQVANDDKERTVEVRLGSSIGELIGTVQIPAADGNFSTVSGKLNKPLDGVQNIYLVFTGEENGLKFRSFNFTGNADDTLYPDITNAVCGSVTSSAKVEQGVLSELIDDRLSSAVVLKSSSEGTKIIYASLAPVHLTAYGLAAAIGAELPEKWTLSASNDSVDWVELDKRSRAEDAQGHNFVKYEVDNTLAYRYFCLASDEPVSLAEWQLYGSLLRADDITADGGILTAAYEGNGADEHYLKLTDKSVDTKYTVKGQTDLWIQYEARASYRLTGYSISSANDVAGCDPKTWVLYASIDGIDWVEADSRSGQIFNQLHSTQVYACDTDAAYRYFKLHITANNGAGDTQLAEWQLFGDIAYDSYSHDFTKSGGVLSSSGVEANDELLSLTDNDAETYCTIDAGQLPVWVQYESTVPVQLQGYSITTSGLDSRYDPKSWKLQGSEDGTTWKDIDIRTGETFELRYGRNDYEKSNSTEYTYFRLLITEANSNEVRIGEWQIYGAYLDKYDVTSNPDGKLTAQWDGNYKLNDNGSVKYDERFSRLIDHNKSGKYCVDGRKFFWVAYQSPRPLNLTAYSLMSANDSPDRDPANWKMYASNNGTDWALLVDQQTGQNFPYRNTTLYYPVSMEGRYTHFKLEVEENNGGKTIQLAEWQLFGTFNEYKEDITEGGGALTASHDDPTLQALIDNSETSKYYLTTITNSQFGDGIWVKYESNVPVSLSSYALTSSNGLPANDPKSWILQGSNDDEIWTDLDTWENISFDSRCERKEFQVPVSAAYKYFRLLVTARKTTAKGFQLAEWELFGTPASGIEQPMAENRLSFYPNPVVESISFKALENSNFIIYNLNGSVVYTRNVSQGNVNIDLKELPQGMYWVRLVTSNNQTESALLIKR